MRKELPHDHSFRGLFGPQRDYPYFEGAATWPFEPASGFDAAQAWWLAEASLLSYVRERDFVAAAWARAGFDTVAFFSERSTHAFAADNGAVCLVVFRGTESDGFEDFKTDLRFLLTTEPGGRVHRGFQEALDLIWPALAVHLLDRPCWFGGHSLGAGLATLAAARHGATQALYTFGSPRVGDAKFRDAFPAPAYRIVNNNDIVTRVPPPIFYHHVGVLKYFDAQRRLRDEPGLWDRVHDQVAGHTARAKENLRRWRAGDFKAIVVDSLVDHSPLHYAIHTWNALRA